MAGSPVTVVFDGGLANQLFQRTAGLVISDRTSREVQFSCRWLGGGAAAGVTSRSLEIPLRAEEIYAGHVPGRLACTAFRRLGPRSSSVLVEASPADDALTRLSGGTRFVVGYFQRADHVEEVWASVVGYLAADPLSDILTKEMGGGIAVHVRLGDYVTNPRAARLHGALDPAYYARSIERLVAQGMPKRVHLVSDDPKEAAARLRNSGLASSIEVVWRLGSSPWEDLAVLAAADAVVMSNSSFSWWGAFMAHKVRAARVVFPPRWFANPAVVEPPLYVEGWMVGR